MPWLQSIRKNGIVIVLALIYLAADMILTAKEAYFLNLLPVVFLIICLALSRLDIVYFLIILCTPLSVQLIEYIPSSPVDFAIPTEPMLFGVMLVVIFKTIRERNLDRRVLNHPVSYAILFYLFWIFLTSITSTMPLVSFKFLLAKIWFIVTFYFVAINVFRQPKNIATFIWCYSGAMLAVIFYTLYRHSLYGFFDKQTAHFVMNPFFRDHTSYGAVLAMLFFAIGGLIIKSHKTLVYKLLNAGLLMFIAVAILFSYTRAAWVSIFISMGILIATILKVRFRYIMAMMVIVFVYFVGQRVVIIQKMEQNRQTASAKLAENLQSISNIRNDESNLERINRWDAAIRMFEAKPVFGWGPGTYMFKYAPFQLWRYHTNISTDFGDLGNAHSEYIGPLAETGAVGSLSFILIIVVALATGYKVYRKISDKRLKRIVLGLILGLFTYVVHGSLNNFLDTDKASSLFWGFIAVFVSLDIYYSNSDTEDAREEINQL